MENYHDVGSKKIENKMKVEIFRKLFYRWDSEVMGRKLGIGIYVYDIKLLRFFKTISNTITV